MFAHGDLWLLSSTRFFHLEDYMIKHNRTELLHVEADNLLYGKVNQLSQNLSWNEYYIFNQLVLKSRSRNFCREKRMKMIWIKLMRSIFEAYCVSFSLPHLFIKFVFISLIPTFCLPFSSTILVQFLWFFFHFFRSLHRMRYPVYEKITTN